MACKEERPARMVPSSTSGPGSRARGNPVTMDPGNIAPLADRILKKYQELCDESVAFRASKKSEFIVPLSG